MPLRLLEVYHPYLEKENIEEFLEPCDILGLWQDKLSETERFTRIMVSQENVDDVIDTLRVHFTKPEDLRVVILPVEACFPRRDEWSCKEEEVEEGDWGPLKRRPPSRTSMMELYHDATEMGTLTVTFVVMSLLAAIVASVGILMNDVAIIIGSMVIAPLLGPNIALTLAATLADWKLGKIALKTSIIGYVFVFVVGIIFGVLYNVDTAATQVVGRTDISLLMVIVALAAGVAGALTFTKGTSEALVGVMVAVALLPPVVASGLLLGDGHYLKAVGAFLLFLVNVLSIKLSGTVTFVLQGVNPSNWLEKEEAKRTTQMAVTVWFCFLILVMVLIVLYQRVEAG